MESHLLYGNSGDSCRDGCHYGTAIALCGGRSNLVKKINCVCGVLGGISFAFIAAYFIPNVVVPLAVNGEFRTWVDIVAICSYVIAAVPMILLALLNVRVLWRKADQACRSITRVLLLASFLVFSHIAMIFGMVDPGIAGYAPEKPAVMQMHHHGGGDCSLQKLM